MLKYSINPDWASLTLFARQGWTRVRFGDVVDNLNETESDPAGAGLERFVGLEHLKPGSLHIRIWGSVADGTTFTRRCRPAQVLFGKRRAYQRKVAVAEFDAVVSGDIYVLAPKDERVLAELLPFICLSERFFKRAVETSNGSLSPRTNWSSLASFEFDLPPLDDQRRIADILWVVDRCKVQHEDLLDNLRSFHKCSLDTAFAKDIKSRRLAEVLVYASDGPFGSKLKTEHYSTAGARVIRLQNIGEGYFDNTDEAFVSQDYFQELKRYEVRPGDVIVAGLGDETHPVGRAALIPGTVGTAINKADCFCVRADTRTILNAYLAYFFNSRIGFEQVAARAQGTTRMRINVRNLKTVLIPVLLLDVQAEVVREIQTIETSLAEVGRALRDDNSMMTALLDIVFGG
ncbi:MAG: restriction endonuclease subunit S [Chloroflexi bacterium]|nr:restriction endonuclease subunit S [Chloroflexota bacterium]